jgi:hypothetical protein
MLASIRYTTDQFERLGLRRSHRVGAWEVKRARQPVTGKLRWEIGPSSSRAELARGERSQRTFNNWKVPVSDGAAHGPSDSQKGEQKKDPMRAASSLIGQKRGSIKVEGRAMDCVAVFWLWP